MFDTTITAGGPIAQASDATALYVAVVDTTNKILKSTDNGRTWKNVTPSGTDGGEFHTITASPSQRGGAYVIANIRGGGEFGPGIGLLRFGLDIVLHRLGTDNGVDRAIKPAGEFLLPVVIGNVVEAERRFGQRKAVSGERAFRVEHAQAHPLLLADLHQQRLLPLAAGTSQRFGGDLRLDPGELEAFVDQLRAIAVEVEQPAAHHQQGQDVDRKDAARQRKAAGCSQLVAAALTGACAGRAVSHR